MIDEKLDESIQKFAQSTRLNDAGRRAGFEGYQPTQSLADTQDKPPPVAQNVPPPPPRPAPPPIQTRADTSLPNVRAGSVYRDASGLHTGRYVTQKDFEEGQAQVEAYKRAHPQVEGRVTSNRYGAWHKRANTLGAGSDGSMGAWSRGGTMGQARPSARGFIAAAQQPAPNAQPVNRIQQIDQRAEAEAKAQAEKREQARRDANVSVGEAFSEALRKFRDDSTAITRNGRERIVEKDANGNELRPGVNGYEAKYRDSANRYRIGMLQPSTIRALNQQRSALGLKESDSIVGIYAVSGVDANGKPTGEPQIITNYRSADGRIHKKVYTYQEAARFVRGTMGEKGDASADDRFASMKQWQDADGNDALGITRTAEYQERRAKLDAANLKNDQTRQQMDLTRQQMEQGKTEFEQKQQALAEAKKNKSIADAKAEVDRLDKLAAAEKNEAAKQNWISQANAARKVLADRQAEARLADITEATEEGASPDIMPQFVKKNGKLVLKDGWMAKKLANGKSIFVLKPGWILGEDGNPVQKPKKVTAKKQNAPANQQTPNPSQPSQQPVVASPAPTTAPTIAEGSNAQRAAIKRAANRIRNWAGRNYIPD